MGFKSETKMKSTEMSADEVSTKGMKSGGMPMVMKDGKKIPAFAAKKGGMPKKMNMGGAMMPDAYNPSMAMKKGGKTKKMAMGGGMPMGALPTAAAPAMGARPPMGAAMGARPPMGRGMPARPAMGARKPDPRQAMIEAAMAQKAAQAPMMRKKGGMAESDKAQDKAMIGKAMKQHDSQQHGKGTTLKLKNGGMHMMPSGKMMKDSAMKKGGMPKYATGGVIQKFATGGVVNGAAGYKDGGFAKVACKDGGGFKAMKKGNC